MINKYRHADTREVIELPEDQEPPAGFKWCGARENGPTCDDRGLPLVSVKREGVDHNGLPVSQFLPLDSRPHEIVNYHGRKVRQQADGTLSTLGGMRIVRNKDDARRHGADCGHIHLG